MRLISRIKQPMRRVLDWNAARGLERRCSELRESLLVLCYHRVLPRNFEELSIVEPGMYVFNDTFQMHVNELLRHLEPVDLAVWLKQRRHGDRLPSRGFAITFDDGWRDNYEFAFPVLQELQVPATVFVVSALAGTKHSFWPERLARRLLSMVTNKNIRSPWLDNVIAESGIELDGLDNEAVSRLIAIAKREMDEINTQHLDELDKLYGAVEPYSGRDLANWSELAEMAQSGLVKIGSHTRHHVRMNDELDEKKLREEIVMSKGEIKSNTGYEAELFCFPNGDTTASSIQLVEQTYHGACTTEVGWNTKATPAHALRRVPLHEDRGATRNAFKARLVESLSRC